MGLIATNEGGSDWELCPEGTYPAVCVTVIDKGTQNVDYQGKKKQQHQCWIGWELPTVLNPDNDNKPYTVGKNYNMSLDDRSNLYRDLKGWRGKKFTEEELTGFDISKVLGTCCMITVEHSKDGKWANVGAVSYLPKEITKPRTTLRPINFDLDNPDLEVFDGLSDKMQERICASVEAFRIGLTPGCTSLSPPPSTDADDQRDYGEGGAHTPIEESDIPF